MERILFEGKVVGTGARVSGAHFFDGRRDYIITRIRDAEHAIYGHYSNDVELFVVDPDTVRRYPSLKDKDCISPDRLEEILQAEQEGRLVVLPKEGQLYYIEEAGGDIWIGNRPILDIIFTAGWGLVGIPFHYCDIGKTFFLTREEAEDVLSKAGDSK